MTTKTPTASSLLILGRQPAFGLAELESLYGSTNVEPVCAASSYTAAIVNVDPSQINFVCLGGSMKLARVLAVLDTTKWDGIEKYLRKAIPAQMSQVPEGKFKLGISVYGMTPQLSVGKLNASALTLKKVIRSNDTTRSVRIVPNKELELNSAQIQHNGLTTPTGLELLIVHDGNSTIIAQTTAVQDIDAYAARDQGRPKRDARVGMLPPKLAQIIINLTGRPLGMPRDASNSYTVLDPTRRARLLDPFCGTGVVLQEALLMGYDVIGTDLDPRMVEYTNTNLQWLQERQTLAGNFETAVGDATSHQWPQADRIVAETYLGQPFASVPSSEKLEQVRSSCNLILKKFLRNIAPQLQTGTRLCLAVPAWQRSPGRFLRLALLDSPTSTARVGLDQNLDLLEDLGYSIVRFEHVTSMDLVYARTDQVVARQLLILVKK